VSCDYIVKGGDELSHVVHRHEPPVAVCDAQNKNIDVCTSSSAEILECDSIKIIHEDEHIIVVDKPSTVPVHPCGSYNFNSLFHILSEQDPSLGKLHNVHRLDRLTSGLTIIAKNTETAKILGKCINDRDECHKIYLARVKGRFPLNAPVDKQYKSIGAPPIVNGEWISDTKLFEKGEAATSFWVSDKNGNHTTSTSLNDVFQSRIDVSRLAYNGMPTEDNKKNYWFNLACPCEITW
jgi:23S rRNA-/tRNA-specific pseudouridylate synthase